MKVTAEKNEKVANMTLASVYPHYVSKVVNKGRTEEELVQVIEWLTGFEAKQLKTHLEEKSTFRTFFNEATIHPNAHMIKGVICGYRIEDIEDTFAIYKQVRCLDKLVDELAKGKKMEKILRN